MGGAGQPEGGRSITRVGDVVFGADTQVTNWVADRIPGFIMPDEPRALGVVRGGRMAAGVVFERYNGVHVEASIAADARGQWASKATLRTLFSYPFETLGCKAISVIIPSSNLQSLNLATKLGFTPEAIVQFAAHDGSSLIVLKMFRENCKWMDEHGKRKSTNPARSVQNGEF